MAHSVGDSKVGKKRPRDHSGTECSDQYYCTAAAAAAVAWKT